MIVFSAICALLIVLALAFVLSPLRRPDRITVGSTETQANLVIYRQQFAEMASDLAARGEGLASHRGGRGAPLARRDDREYREYLSEEQRSRRGCIARRMQPDVHHGLPGHGHGILTDEQYLREREELEQRLIIDLPNDSRANGKTSAGTVNAGLSSDMFSAALAFGITVSAVLLYILLGSPSFLVQIP